MGRDTNDARAVCVFGGQTGSEMIGPPSGEEVGRRIGIQQAVADDDDDDDDDEEEEEEEEADFN